MKLSDLKNSKCYSRNKDLENLFSSPGKKVQVRRSSKALDWMDINLSYWANQNAVTLEREYLFAPGRKYRSDWAIPSLKLIIEFEGGIFMAKGGHNSASGIQRDIDKYKLADQLGWKVLRYTALNYKNVLADFNEITRKEF